MYFEADQADAEGEERLMVAARRSARRRGLGTFATIVVAAAPSRAWRQNRADETNQPSAKPCALAPG